MIEEYITKHESTSYGDSISYVQPLVRCKDCRRATDYTDEEEYASAPYRCRKYGDFHPGDWFCAGGERKTNLQKKRTMEKDRIIQVIKDQLALCGTNPETDRYWVTFTADDARLILELLKEQEAVEPKTESSVYDPDSWWFVCGSCKKGVISPGDRFCGWCGRAVKWE